MSRRILAITQAIDDPATRYRIGLYVPLAAERGVEIVVVPWPREEAARGELIARAREFDSVVVQRRLMPRRQAKMLRAAAKWLAFDFDDAVIYSDSARGRPRLLLDKWWQFNGLISCCDGVTAGNGYLAATVRDVQVAVVPTAVDPSRYKLSTRPTGNVLGWIGHRSTLPYLERLAEPLAELSRRVPGLRLRCIADIAPALPGVRVEHRPWSEAGEVEELRQLDVGLAPLPEDRWTRGKCGLRLLQYLAAGVPAVASPVGVQGEIVAKGAAIPAGDSQGWVAAVEELLADSEIRREMIARGRKLVEEEYCPQRWIDTVLAAWTGEKR